MEKELLTRIVEALERLAPVDAAHPLQPSTIARWTGTKLVPTPNFNPLPLDLLTGIDAQKALLLDNTLRLAKGHAAHDVLLWGVRGSGKSALVKSVCAAVHGQMLPLRLIEASGLQMDQLPHLFDKLASQSGPTIVFIDDLGFDVHDAAGRHLRSILEGGVAARPAHIRLYVTSNRRHILPRDMAEQSSAINPRDVIDDQLALADRFGLSIGFHTCTQADYLAMVSRYADHLGLCFDPQEALTWAAQRGARSGRVAWQFATELAGRNGLPL